MEGQKERMSNMELLRVFSMLMIVMIHLMDKTEAITDIEAGRPMYYAGWILMAVCRTGNNCFVLISGYFSKESRFRLEKLLRLYVQVFFYSVTIAALMVFLHVDLTSSRLLAVVLPVTHREYWFATVYIGLYCLMPFLNIMVDRTEERELRHLLIVLGILFSVIPTFFYASGWMGESGAYSIVWFVFLYLAGAYIRNYGREMAEKYKSKWIYCFLGTIGIVPLVRFAAVLLEGTEIAVKAPAILYSSNSLPMLCASLCLLMFFCSVRIERPGLSRAINRVGGLTFGIYLIHNNVNLSHYLWEKCRVHYWFAEKGNLLVVMGILIAVFAACGFVEWLRQQLFKVLKTEKLIKWAAETMEKAVYKAGKRNEGADK
ncbi:MAG: acyltransferase [Blautia sp.]|nr:acyltransferase [Blautia sp.]MCM1200940.1 acyltransferase [Bacteroides fragilis]